VLRIGVLNGSIRIVGKDGKDVDIEARLHDPGFDEEQDVDEQDERRRKSAGMRRLRNTATGLSVEEEGNVMEVGVSALHRTVDLVLKVPRRTTLELSTVNNGDIEVDGIEGDLEVENTNGGVTLTHISGSVVAHALNGNVVVSFDRVDPKKSMSFSSLNGDIDVTLPDGVRANVRTKADNGDVYSDFDIQMDRRSAPRLEETKSKKQGKKFRIDVDSGMTGTLNGGGPEYRFETYNGTIYIRKK
jgi:DUF4097 and DUF4098 domain-containing protein YvlB